MQELAELSEKAREQAMARFRLLEPHLIHGQDLQAVAAGSGMSFRTLQRWVAQYRKLGLIALARRSREDRGTHRTVSLKLKSTVEGLALEKPPLPISSIYRQACQFAGQIGEPAPSYATVYAIVRALPKDLLLLAHRGTRAYGEIYDLVHRREASWANAIWQVDHAQLPIRLTRDDGSTARPWLTIVIDDFSRAVAGY